MIRDLTVLASQQFDLLVIGGGINGAAIANIATRRGLKTALIDKGDFASGTSSKSTKLIHGGIRYLENLEFNLVEEALRERHIQLKCVPYLVKPIQFIIPVYRGDKRPFWMMRFGVFLYDAIAGRYTIKKHQNLTARQTLQLEPNLKKEGLVGSVSYYDAQMDDARLCLENVLAAAEKGAQAANYVEAEEFLKNEGRVVGVTAQDKIRNTTFRILAKRIVCAVGPWTNYVLGLDAPYAKKQVRTTKGVHMVYKGRISNHALLIPSQCDKRVFFVIPWLGNSLIGTTDTDYVGKPDNVRVEREDIEYLMKEARRVLPRLELKEADIITTFAGLRPLVRSGGVAPFKASRKHSFVETDSGVIFVIGGKYTTYRKIAEECVNLLTTPKFEKEYWLYGSGVVHDNLVGFASKYGIPVETIKKLIEKYGLRFKDVLRETEADSQLKENFCSCNPFIKAQIVYAIRKEMAQTVEDITLRRLSIGYLTCSTKDCENVIKRFVDELCPKMYKERF